jgi:hypothetical protein
MRVNDTGADIFFSDVSTQDLGRDAGYRVGSYTSWIEIVAFVVQLFYS